MTHAARPVRGPVNLKIVGGFMAMTMKLINRDAHLPGLGVCHGPSGYGKTQASIFARNMTGAIVVEVGDSWNKKILLQRILFELGEQSPKGRTIGELSMQASEILGRDPNRPLIVDEADRLVDKGLIEIIRELHEMSQAPVILIGEEELPRKLLRIERVHNRVLEWFPAEACDSSDARLLADSLCPNIEIADDLVELIRQQADGRARRIVVNLARLSEAARNEGTLSFDVAAWGTRGFYTGEPPAARQTHLYRRVA